MRREVTFEEIPFQDLVFDERVQRALRPLRVREIAANLDVDALGVIIASARPSASSPTDVRVVIDGQHRTHAMLHRGLGEETAFCLTFHNLSVEEEAGLFRRFNNTSRTSAVEDLLKGIVEGEAESVSIAKICERSALTISKNTGDGLVSCAGAMRRIYRSGARGPAALGFALHVATTAWGVTRDAVDGHIVTGLAQIYLRFGEDIDRDSLITKLAKYEGKATSFLVHAKSVSKLRPSLTAGKCAAEAAMEIYNRGRRDRLAWVS